MITTLKHDVQDIGNPIRCIIVVSKEAAALTTLLDAYNLTLVLLTGQCQMAIRQHSATPR